MTTTKNLRAALYARVSTSDQNPRMQIDELREFAGRRGYDEHAPEDGGLAAAS